MNERIAHRGPDASGIHCVEDDRFTAYLAHRRLSIIDLSGRGRPADVQRAA